MMRTIRHSQRVRARMIANFRKLGRVDLACEATGIDRSTHYVWMKEQPAYRLEFEAAREEVADLLEAEAYRRAYQGVDEPVFHAGKRAIDFVRAVDGKLEYAEDGKPIPVLASIRRYSDNLLMFLLKGRRREVFGDKLEATGKDGSPLFGIADVRAYMRQAPEDGES